MPWGGCFWVIRVILFRLQVLMLITTLMVVNGWHSLDSLAKGGIELRARECKYRFLAVCWHHVATTNFILSQAMQNMFSRHHGLPIGLSTTFFQSFNFFFFFFFFLITHNTQVRPFTNGCCSRLQEHSQGPDAEARELEELTQIYVGRGLSYYLAKQVSCPFAYYVTQEGFSSWFCHGNNVEAFRSVT